MGLKILSVWVRIPPYLLLRFIMTKLNTKWICKYCNINFNNRTELRAHNKTEEHIKLRTEYNLKNWNIWKRSEYGTWKCKFCGIICDTKHLLYNHYRSHPEFNQKKRYM